MRSRWLSGRALLLHLTLLVVAPGCLVAGWWQATVALSGNALSYVYTVEWPAFAVFAVVVWWHLLHDDPETVGARGLQHAIEESKRSGDATEEEHDRSVRRPREEDEGLAAYNDYLASLSGNEDAKTWRKPWRPPAEQSR